MLGFRTKNSVYYVDESEQKISGGIFGTTEVGYKEAQIIVGEPAIIELVNGMNIKTSRVLEYLNVGYATKQTRSGDETIQYKKEGLL